MGKSNIYYFEQYTVMISGNHVYLMGLDCVSKLYIETEILIVFPQYLELFPADQQGKIIHSFLNSCITIGVPTDDTTTHIATLH